MSESDRRVDEESSFATFVCCIVYEFVKTREAGRYTVRIKVAGRLGGELPDIA